MEKLSAPAREARTPPHNLEAESGLLGAMLLAVGDVTDVFQRLRPEHFFAPRHQKIYQAIATLYEEKGAVDTVLLRDRLEREGTLEDIGGLEYLMQLTESLSTTANAYRYAEIVMEKELLRRLIDTCTGILEEAYESVAEASRQVDVAESRIFELAETQGTNEAVPMSDAVQSTFDLIDKWHKGDRGLPSGYADLDEITNGLQPSELIVVAGRPSMGKTTLSLNIAQNCAAVEGKAVAIFSLEMDRRQLALNLLCGTARIESQAVRRGSLAPRDWGRLTNAADLLSKAPIYIDDSPNLNTMSIRAKARRLRKKRKVDLIVIDYLQLLELGTGRPESRQQEISAISRSLKGLARELEIPVITISQLSRAVESREDHRPRMSDLRESGAIEQDADVILLLYREEYYKPDKEDAQGRAEVIVAKHRNGPTGSAQLAFIGEYLRFENLSRYQEEF